MMILKNKLSADDLIEMEKQEKQQGFLRGISADVVKVLEKFAFLKMANWLLPLACLMQLIRGVLPGRCFLRICAGKWSFCIKR